MIEEGISFMTSNIILFVGAYLLGSIPSGVWIGRIFFHKDIRKYGSGNTGTTNTFRVLGKKAGIAVFVIDLLKGTLATCLPYIFGSSINPLWFGLTAILGHTFPIFASFKGGKAVATSGGLLLGYNPAFFFFSLALYLIILYITSTVSLTSMLSAIIITLSTLILPYVAPAILPTHDWLLTLIALGLTIFICLRHRENVGRIKSGTESTIGFGRKKKKQSRVK